MTVRIRLLSEGQRDRRHCLLRTGRANAQEGARAGAARFPSLRSSGFTWHRSNGEHRFPARPGVCAKGDGTGSGNLAVFAIEGDAYIRYGRLRGGGNGLSDTVQALGRTIASPLVVAYMSDSRMAYLWLLGVETPRKPSG